MLENIVQILNQNEPACAAKFLNTEGSGDGFIEVNPESILSVCQTLKTHHELGFHVLQLVTGCDYPEQNKISVTYVLANFYKNTEILLKTFVDRNKAELDSVCSVWKSANFQERECYDMLGVQFKAHPDFRRILCPDDWEGYPLRKDYAPAEEYQGMKINPEHKMNIADRQFGKKAKAKE